MGLGSKPDLARMKAFPQSRCEPNSPCQLFNSWPEKAAALTLGSRWESSLSFKTSSILSDAVEENAPILTTATCSASCWANESHVSLCTAFLVIWSQRGAASRHNRKRYRSHWEVPCCLNWVGKVWSVKQGGIGALSFLNSIKCFECNAFHTPYSYQFVHGVCFLSFADLTFYSLVKSHLLCEIFSGHGDLFYLWQVESKWYQTIV